MNHFAMALNSPTLWLGAITFRNNRIDVYEALLAKLDPQGRSSVQTVGQIFEEWAERERARKDSLMFVYEYVRRKSDSLAEALRPFVDNDEYLILIGGEQRGNLVMAIQSLIDNMRAKQQMATALRAAAYTPAIGIVSMLGLSILYGLTLWPEFMREIPLRFWDAWVLPCIHAQLALASYWPWTFALLGLWAAHTASVERWTGRSRALFDHLPPWSTYKGRLGANTLTVMASLVGSGMTMREAFVMIRDRATPYTRWHMDRIIRRYDRVGEKGVEALRHGLFSTRMLDRIEDASSGRTFDQTLREVGGRSMSVIVKTLQVQAWVSSTIVLTLVGILFAYTTMCVVFGVQDATNAYIASVTRAAGPGG